MSNINDKATVSLFVNGEQAEAAMKRLSDKAQDLNKKLQDALAAGDKKAANKLQRELDKVNKELDRTESAAKGTGIVLDNLANTSIHGLRNALKYLERELSMTKPNTEQWRTYAAQIESVKERINELTEELEGGQSAWGKFKNWAVSAWPAIDLIKQGYDELMQTLHEYVDAYASMDQEMANVRKFTGMTANQVADLNEEFKSIDTRSSREQLNKLAQEAGRLGLSSQEDVLGFVRAADKINVALDDLGDGATLTLSKLTDIFGDKERFGVEQSLLKTGSVINELSQSCSASAPYIADFAKRMGGVGVQADLTVSQIMGLGAVLDSIGLEVESSSTAVSQVLVRMMRDPAKYARVAGLEVTSFAEKLRTDANGALLEFLDALNKAGGMNVLAPMFADMGENGSRAITTLSSLSKNIDLVRQRQQEASVAFEEGISIDKEFEVQNTTVQASLEKAQKRFQELRIELGAKLSPLMAHIISSTSAMAKAFSVVIDFCIEHKTALLVLTTTIGSYYVAVGTATIAQKAWNAAVLLGKNAVAAFKYTVGLCQVGMIALTHGTKAAGTAFTFLNATMKANPFGLVISLLATLAAIISKLVSKTEDFNSKMRDSINTAFKYNEQMEKELTELDKLVGALEGATEGTEEYDKAKNALLSKYGAYLDGLVTEEGKILDLETAYKRLAEAIRIANEERGIEEARKAVDDTYFEQMSSLQKQLMVSLVAYGADQREAARLAMHVSTAMSSNRALSDETIARLNRLSENVPNAEAAEGLFANLSPASQNSSIGELFGVKQIPQPAAVVNDMYGAQNIRKTALNEVDIIQRQQRPYGDLVDAEIQSMIDSAKKAVDAGGGTVLKITDTIAGIAGFVDVSADEAKKLLEQLQGEMAFRNGNRNNNSSSNDIGSVDPITQDNPPSSTIDNTPDRFAEEKAWRERQEAEARIAYAKGEVTYSEHTARMAQIAEDYYQKLLDRADVAGDEELKIRAEYEEACKKSREASNKHTLDEENRNYQDLLDRLRANHQQRISQEGMTASDLQREQRYYAEVTELAELQHLQNIVDIYKDGSDEKQQAQRNLRQKEIAAQERHLKEMERWEQEYAKIKNDVFGMSQSEKDAEYARQHDALTAVYNQELAAAGDNEAEKLRIKEAYMAAELAMRKEYNQQGAEDASASYKGAIAASLEWLRGEGGQALQGTMSTLTSGMSSIFSGLSSMVQAELEIQTASINRRYDAEIDRAEGNTYKVKKLEKQKQADIAKAKNEANKKMFAMQVIQAVAQTATNALAAFGSAAAIPVVGHVLAPIAAAMAVAAGAIQIAAIKKQQQASEAQGYSKGGFTKPGAVDEPAGIVHAGEWVASQKLLANPIARPMIEALDLAQRTNTIGSLRPEDVSRSIRANDSLARIAEGDNQGALMVAAFAQNAQAVGALVNRLNEPFATVNTVSGDHGIQKAQDEYAKLMKNKTPRSGKSGKNK